MVIFQPHRVIAQPQVVIILPHRDIAQPQVQDIPPHRDIKQRQVHIFQPHRVYFLVLRNGVKGLGQTARLAPPLPMLNKCNMFFGTQQHLQVHRFTFI